VTDCAIPFSWDRAGLEAGGFGGFVPLIGLDRTLLPQRRAVYAVIRLSDRPPVFLDVTPAVKRKIHSVADLSLKWIEDASVVYIGNAESKRGVSDRLRAFGRQASNHSGGRALWQLADAHELVVDRIGVRTKRVQPSHGFLHPNSADYSTTVEF
jgi:hypothetical protein